MTTLKNVLLINAISSGVTGLLLVALPAWIAALFGVSVTAPFVGVGIFLFAFAVLVFIVAVRRPVSDAGVKFVIALDCVWVFVSACLIIFQMLPISILGNLFIAAVAAWVALMVMLQRNGLKKIVMSN
jgi:hypothetical protein